MISFPGKMVLLDIEGTVSPLAFVHEVMFPYARDHVAAFVDTHLDLEAIADSEASTLAPAMFALDQMARDAGHPSFAEWCPSLNEAKAFIVAEVHKLMDADVKATGLKLLQGLIWEQGFAGGELRSTLFADVRPALEDWRTAWLDVRIYSSGSVHAQKMFFSHTVEGNLTPHFAGYYDTAIGSKRAAGSYQAIAQDAGVSAGDILFVSDIVAELDAARDAGLLTALAVRPGNTEPPPHTHPALTSLLDITRT